MKNVFKIILLAAIVALGVWLWLILFPSPEKAVRKQLTKLAKTVSFSPTENNLAKIADAESVANFFSTNVEILINAPEHEPINFSSRAEITQAALLSRQTVNSLEVKFPDINVTVAPDKNSATADVTVEANVSGEHDAILQEVKFTFEKNGRKWLIKKIETVRVLSQSGILNFEVARDRFIIFA